MTALWLDRALPRYDTALPDDGVFEDVVVGGGITGLTTALLLARAGRKVGVIEAGRVGGLTTGHTTAKVSLLQGTKLSSLLQHTSRTVAAAYLEANTQGLAWLNRFCDEHDVAYQRRDAVTFAASPDETAKVRKEHEAAETLGLAVRWEDRLDVPFPSHGATVLGGQVQLDPVELVQALATQLRAHGGTIHEGLRVRSVSKTGRPEPATGGRHRGAGGATWSSRRGLPSSTGGSTSPRWNRSAPISWPTPGPRRPRGCTSPLAPRAGRCATYRTGRGVRCSSSEAAGTPSAGPAPRPAHVDELRSWAAEHFPRATETHAWSAQDYSPHDGIPHVGRLPRGLGHMYVATGFNKWGMTNGVAAGLAMAGQILGSRPSWATTLQRRATRPRARPEIARMNAGVGLAGAIGTQRHRRVGPRRPAGGGRRVTSAGPVWSRPVTATVDGVTCGAAICTHLGGPLKWNDEEKLLGLHTARFALRARRDGDRGACDPTVETARLTRSGGSHRAAGVWRPSKGDPQIVPRLRTVSPRMPGWTRVRCGRGFRYLDQNGNRLPPEDVERVRGLVIPPAWREVWICPYPSGHLQATGVDEAGRTQYLYHPEWRRQRDEAKFDRVIEMARILPRVRRRLDRTLDSGAVGPDEVLAAAVRLIDLGCFRVGSEVYTDLYGSFGLTTLQRQHVRRNGTGYLFDYVGKSGMPQQVHIVDESVSGVVEQLLRRRNAELPFLSYRDGRRWRPVTAADVNAYMGDLFVGEVTAKDFRTWRATASVAASLAWSPAARQDCVGHGRSVPRCRLPRSTWATPSPWCARRTSTHAWWTCSRTAPRSGPSRIAGSRTERQTLDRLDRAVVKLLT